MGINKKEWSYLAIGITVIFIIVGILSFSEKVDDRSRKLQEYRESEYNYKEESYNENQTTTDNLTVSNSNIRMVGALAYVTAELTNNNDFYIDGMLDVTFFDEDDRIIRSRIELIKIPAGETVYLDMLASNTQDTPMPKRFEISNFR